MTDKVLRKTHPTWPCGHQNNPDNMECWQCGASRTAPRAAEAVEDDTYERIGVFQRTAELDKSIKDGDKFDGDAWTVWIRIGAVPDGSLGKSMFEDLTPNLSHAEKIWRCKTCGVEQDSFGPVTPAEPVSFRPAIIKTETEVAEGAGDLADELAQVGKYLAQDGSLSGVVELCLEAAAAIRALAPRGQTKNCRAGTACVSLAACGAAEHCLGEAADHTYDFTCQMEGEAYDDLAASLARKEALLREALSMLEDSDSYGARNLRGRIARELEGK